MASTFTLNTGIEKPGTGEQSGTWGNTTNTNFDIIDRALSGVGAITLTGTSHTLTTTDGSLTDGMFKVLVLGGSPSGTNTITIGDNTQDKLYFVVNNSGQEVQFSQGTGANATIANGAADIIYADGAGSGAAVASFFGTALKIGTDLTIGDDLTLNSDSAVLGFGADTDTTLTHTDGTGLTLNSTNKLTFGDAASFIQQSGDGILRIDGEATIDLNASTAVTISNDLKLDSDDAVLSFGADSDVTVTHDPDDGLILKSTATGDDNPFLLTLQTGETDIAANDVLGKIAFQAPDEGTDTDSRLLAAAIQARSEGDFAADNNATSMDFMTGASEAATTKMTLNSAGTLEVLKVGSGSAVTLKMDGSTIGELGVISDRVYLEAEGSHSVVLDASGDDFFPGTTTGTDNDGNIDLGHSAAQWKDFYLAGNVKIGTAGKGIDFTNAAAGQAGAGTDPAETSTATVLDDYEEGTFTPVSNSVFIGSGSLTQVGMYVKVGNLVNISVRFTPSGGSTNGHQFGIHLPFEAATTESSGSFNSWFGNGAFSNAPNGNGADRVWQLGGDTNYVDIKQQGTTSTSQITGNSMGGTFSMSFSITYRTTS